MRYSTIVRCLTTLLLCSLCRIGPAYAQEAPGVPPVQYKKQSRDVIARIVEGEVDAALRDAAAYLAAHPGDHEALFGLVVGYTRQGDLQAALRYVEEAVRAGLPFERFLAGPRDLLRPLTETDGFRRLARRHGTMLLHGPVLGGVTERSARFWVRTAAEVPIQVILRPAEGGGPAVRTDVVRTAAAADYTAVVVAEGLRPDTPYTYELHVDGRPGEPSPGAAWAFRTFPPAGRPARFQVGFGGGAGYTPAFERMWTTIAAHRLPAFLLLGDNVYIDHPTLPAVQQYCYYRRQSRPEYRAFAAATSVFAIWDDHDFTSNDGWGGPEVDRPAWKLPVWNVFRANWNNPSYGGGDARPGVWFSFSMGDVDFFMLDGRYYRTSPHDPAPSMLGAVQKQWLLEALRASKATFKVIASPVPWAFGSKTGTMGTPEGRQAAELDTWEGFPDEREELFSFLEANRIEGVVLLSADRHRSDLWRIERPGGYDLYEFESSKLTNEHTHAIMPGSLFGYNAQCSFGLLTFDTTKPDPEVAYEIVNLDGEVVHTFRLRRSQLLHAAGKPPGGRSGGR